MGELLEDKGVVFESYAFFGCIESRMKLNWTRNFKFKMEMIWLPIRILLFGYA